ncbi:MAG: metallophosphoesterase [Isosphaeraceae bacterium]
MKVWAIADLHLSLGAPNRLERERKAGRKTDDRLDRLENEWRDAVDRNDLVLIPGDVSMARNHREVQADLAWLDRLPGTKVIAPGNHDRWWNGVDKIRPMLRRTILAVGGDAIEINGAVVCGTKGSIAKLEENAGEDPELLALSRALEHAISLRDDGRPLYVLWHYPPFDIFGRPGPCTELISNAQATACVYGHLHARDQWARTPRGIFGATRYEFVAAEAIGFRPLRVDRP